MCWVFRQFHDEFQVGYFVNDTFHTLIITQDRRDAMRYVNYLNGGDGMGNISLL